MCYIKNGKLKWDPQMDHYTKNYNYRHSGDTLFFSNPSEIVKTYLRQTNDGSKFGGRWILLENKSENHLTIDELYEFCTPCEDIERTNNSIKFTRKGMVYEISLDNPIHNEKKALSL